MIEPIPERLGGTLRQTLTPGERVLVQLKGAFTEVLVCTDFRVLILKGGWMTGQLFGTNTFQCPYANIAGVEVKFHLMTGYFELSAGGMQNTPKSFWKIENKPRAAPAPNCVSICGQGQARKFRQACAFIMARLAGRPRPYSAGSDAIAALERLARLRASGVLSGAEFRQDEGATAGESLTSGRLAKGGSRMEIEAVLILVFLVFYLIWSVIKGLYRLLTGAARREREERQRWLLDGRCSMYEMDWSEAVGRIRQHQRTQARAKARAARGVGFEASGSVSQDEAYEMLGVRPGCTTMELAAAYRRKISQWHPDKLDSMADELKAFATRRTATDQSGVPEAQAGGVGMQATGLGRENSMEMFDTYILTSLKIDSDGKVVSTNVAVTFDIHEAEAHREADAANDFQIFSVPAEWREDAEQSSLVKTMRDFREMVRQWQEEALR